MKLLSLALGDARGGATDMDRGDSLEDTEVPVMDPETSSSSSSSLSLGPSPCPSLGGLNLGSSMRFQRVCVFCGSTTGNKDAFSHAAYDLGNRLVQRRMNLVYGGGSVGLMGLISKTVFNGGCHVVGVIPKALVSHEISGQAIGEVKVVADMHERKAEMARQADAFIALPGGYGTLEELLEIIAWSQLGIHNKPVGLLNVDGYYNALLALFDKGVEEGFIKPSSRHIVVSATNADELLCRMEEYVPMHDCVAPRHNWEVEELNEFSFGTQQ